jgi:hypothetical protein
MAELLSNLSELLLNFSSKGLVEKASVVIITAVLTAVGQLTWLFLKYARHRIRWHTKTFRISLEPGEGLEPTINRSNYGALLSEITGFYCIVARFGTEEYLRDYASDDERAEGSWQMRVTRLGVEFDQAGNAQLILKVPVHRYLGTQFKCFVALRNPNKDGLGQRWTELLKRCKNIARKTAAEKIETVAFVVTGQRRDRVYFLLEQFGQCYAGPTIVNNYILDERGDLP